MAEALSENSTTGRIQAQRPPRPKPTDLRLGAVRAAFRLLDALSPGTAARLAADLFTKPVRRAAPPVPDLPALPPDAILDVGRRLGPVHAVIGHSLGGTASTLALSRGLKADRAVLLASPAGMPHYARRFAAAVGLSPRTAEAMIEAIHQRTGGVGALDVPRLAPAQTARLLVLHDPADREVRFEDGEQIVRAWPGARLDAMPGCGHTRLLRDADAIRRVVEFVRADSTALPLAG